MRFIRDYELVIGVGSQAVIVKPPIKIAFSCDKSISGSLNKMNINIFNLKESNRLAIVKNSEDSDIYIPIQLSVGYKDKLEPLFKGSVHRGENSREGADFVSSIECLDGGVDFINSFTSKTVKSGQRDAILADMPNTTKGKMTTPNSLQRPKVLVGNSAQLLSDTLDDNETWYIDNEQLFVIKDDEVISSYIPVVNAESGLLNTPQNEQYKITFDTMMNPSLKIGGLCRVESKTAPHLNGTYKIETINYSGDNYGNDWKQAVTALLQKTYKVL